MLKVSRITRIRDHRVFKDFSWPVSLEAFGRYNVIYGWNASGKTTLSSLFRHAERRSVVTEGEIEFELNDGRKVAGAHFDIAEFPAVRVFNRDFIEQTILTASSEIEPIYYLGEESVAKQREVERLRRDLKLAKAQLETGLQTKDAAEKELDDHCKSKARIIKDGLVGTHSTEYMNYDKRHFREAAEEAVEGSHAGPALTDVEKGTLRRKKDSQPRTQVAIFALAIPFLEEMRERALALLSKPLKATLIPELAGDSEIGSWVQRGLALHSGEHAKKHCMFCGERIPGNRLEALEGHFNEDVTELQDNIDAEVQLIEGHLNALEAIRFYDASRLYDHLADEYESAVVEAGKAFQERTHALQALRDALLIKRTAPFEAVSLPFLPERALAGGTAITEALEVVNSVIRTHNQISEQFEAEVESACKALEQSYITEALPEYLRLKSVVESANNSLQPLRERPALIIAEIEVSEREIIGHRRPAEELNADLRSYLGHDELRLAVREAGYAMTRGGSPATNLSEGEKTAIAFLYFLKSLQDKGFDSANGIVVVDDPVSSLDANSLFSAFGCMKERTKGVGQLFILTHNFGFFRQVKNWFHHMPNHAKKDPDVRPARFYLLRARVEHGLRTAALGPMDPMLEQCESEYQFLFKTVCEEARREDEEGDLAHYYGMPNIARRLLEAFLAFRFPDMGGDLTKRLDVVNFDPEKKTRILRHLHTYSHAASIADPEHDPTILSETRPVLCDLLELMRTVDQSHFDAMVRLINVPEPVE